MCNVSAKLGLALGFNRTGIELETQRLKLPASKLFTMSHLQLSKAS